MRSLFQRFFLFCAAAILALQACSHFGGTVRSVQDPQYARIIEANGLQCRGNLEMSDDGGRTWRPTPCVRFWPERGHIRVISSADSVRMIAVFSIPSPSVRRYPECPPVAESCFIVPSNNAVDSPLGVVAPGEKIGK